MFRAYKYRIYPNADQIKKIENSFGVCRLVYNMGLEIRITAWKQAQKRVSGYDLMKQLPELRKEYTWIREVDSQALIACFNKLDVAYKNFFKGKGFPRFKKKSNRQSFDCPSNTRKIDFEKGLLTIPKIPNIKISISRKFDGKMKTVTITRAPTGKYYAIVLVEKAIELPVKKSITPETTIGIDLGIKDFIVTSEGVKVANPHYLRNDIERIKILDKRASRKKKGSNNRKKANLRVAILHERIHNKRIDFLHKLSSRLINDNQVNTICMESLRVSNMVKNHNLAQAISDVSWSKFKECMEYKAEWAGKNLLFVDTFFPSSKTCFNCKHINKELELNQREWKCEKCHSTHDRDINASRNIKFMGLSQSGQGMPVEPVRVACNSKGNDAGTLEKLIRND